MDPLNDSDFIFLDFLLLDFPIGTGVAEDLRAPFPLLPGFDLMSKQRRPQPPHAS